MLQQTQVKTVLELYYQPFLQRFPDLASLAKVDLSEVMQQWQGLGYYRRAKYLHQTARLAGLTLPDTLEGLMALPGIGKNTAHAVLAFAHHQPYPVMEANVKRVLCRIFKLEQPTDTQLWNHAFELLNQQEPFDYNQAMMDVGAMICTPKAPLCDECPARGICAGRSNPMAYPMAKPKKVQTVRRQQILVIEDQQGLVYSPPRTGDFLHGLHQFVELGHPERAIELNGTIYPKEQWQYLGAVAQTYSHFKQVADVYRLGFKGTHGQLHWYKNKQLAGLPLSKKEEQILILIWPHKS